MKHIKKLAGVLLALAMVLCLAVPAWAETTTEETTTETKTISAETSDESGLEGHTYYAYQIFSGTQTGKNNDTTLGDIEWGSGIRYADGTSEGDTGLLTALENSTAVKVTVYKLDSTSGEVTSETEEVALSSLFGKVSETDAEGTTTTRQMTAAEVAEVLSTRNETSNSLANAFAKIAYDHTTTVKTQLNTTTKDEGKDTYTTTIAPGYYLVVDETLMEEDGSKKDDVLNAALLQVTGNTITIGKKNGKPTLEKKVKENAKAVTDESNTFNEAGSKTNGGWNDVADYTIGDYVTFRLIASIPDVSQYDTYKLVFHDTLAKGLDAPSITDTDGSKNLKVYIADDKQGVGDDFVEIPQKYEDANKNDDDGDGSVQNWTLSDAETDAKSGEKSFTVTVTDVKNMKNAEGKAISYVGENNATKYIIVEYSVKLNSSAEIGQTGNQNTAYLEYYNNPNNSGSGENKPTGETPKDKVIVFTYELDVTKIDAATKDKTKEEDGKTVPDYTVLKDAEFVLIKKETDPDDSTKTIEKVAKLDTNNKVESWEAVTTDSNTGKKDYSAGTTLKSDADGKFKIAGLDDGIYYLRETKAPAGYNILTTDLTVTISANTVNDQAWDLTPANAFKQDKNNNDEVTKDKLEVKTQQGTEKEVSGTADVDTGVASIIVGNNQGGTLPETGGIGTTLFYVVGGALAVCAGVLLITKKRMSE